MNVTRTAIPDILIIEPRVFCDERGEFFESYQRERYEAIGLRDPFVQDNYSWSEVGVLRGLHYQLQQPQGKLVSCLAGEIFDVAVDLRQSSPTFGKFIGIKLDGQSRRQLYIPPGFAHGFVALTAAAVSYKCTNYYAPHDEQTLLWSDTTLDISWPCDRPKLSSKDQQGLTFETAPKFTS